MFLVRALPVIFLWLTGLVSYGQDTAYAREYHRPFMR